MTNPSMPQLLNLANSLLVVSIGLDQIEWRIEKSKKNGEDPASIAGDAHLSLRNAHVAMSKSIEVFNTIFNDEKALISELATFYLDRTDLTMSKFKRLQDKILSLEAVEPIVKPSQFEKHVGHPPLQGRASSPSLLSTTSSPITEQKAQTEPTFTSSESLIERISYACNLLHAIEEDVSACENNKVSLSAILPQIRDAMAGANKRINNTARIIEGKKEAQAEPSHDEISNFEKLKLCYNSLNDRTNALSLRNAESAKSTVKPVASQRHLVSPKEDAKLDVELLELRSVRGDGLLDAVQSNIEQVSGQTGGKISPEIKKQALRQMEAAPRCIDKCLADISTIDEGQKEGLKKEIQTINALQLRHTTLMDRIKSLSPDDTTQPSNSLHVVNLEEEAELDFSSLHTRITRGNELVSTAEQIIEQHPKQTNRKILPDVENQALTHMTAALKCIDAVLASIGTMNTEQKEHFQKEIQGVNDLQLRHTTLMDQIKSLSLADASQPLKFQKDADKHHPNTTLNLPITSNPSSEPIQSQELTQELKKSITGHEWSVWTSPQQPFATPPAPLQARPIASAPAITTQQAIEKMISLLKESNSEETRERNLEEIKKTLESLPTEARNAIYHAHWQVCGEPQDDSSDESLRMKSHQDFGRVSFLDLVDRCYASPEQKIQALKNYLAKLSPEENQKRLTTSSPALSNAWMQFEERLRTSHHNLLKQYNSVKKKQSYTKEDVDLLSKLLQNFEDTALKEANNQNFSAQEKKAAIARVGKWFGVGSRRDELINFIQGAQTRLLTSHVPLKEVIQSSYDNLCESYLSQKDAQNHTKESIANLDQLRASFELTLLEAAENSTLSKGERAAAQGVLNFWFEDERGRSQFMQLEEEFRASIEQHRDTTTQSTQPIAAASITSSQENPLSAISSPRETVASQPDSEFNKIGEMINHFHNGKAEEAKQILISLDPEVQKAIYYKHWELCGRPLNSSSTESLRNMAHDNFGLVSFLDLEGKCKVSSMKKIETLYTYLLERTAQPNDNKPVTHEQPFTQPTSNIVVTSALKEDNRSQQIGATPETTANSTNSSNLWVGFYQNKNKNESGLSFYPTSPAQPIITSPKKVIVDLNAAEEKPMNVVAGENGSTVQAQPSTSSQVSNQRMPSWMPNEWSQVHTIIVTLARELEYSYSTQIGSRGEYTEADVNYLDELRITFQEIVKRAAGNLSFSEKERETASGISNTYSATCNLAAQLIKGFRTSNPSPTAHPSTSDQHLSKWRRFRTIEKTFSNCLEGQYRFINRDDQNRTKENIDFLDQILRAYGAVLHTATFAIATSSFSEPHKDEARTSCLTVQRSQLYRDAMELVKTFRASSEQKKATAEQPAQPIVTPPKIASNQEKPKPFLPWSRPLDNSRSPVAVPVNTSPAAPISKASSSVTSLNSISDLLCNGNEAKALIGFGKLPNPIQDGIYDALWKVRGSPGEGNPLCNYDFGKVSFLNTNKQERCYSTPHQKACAVEFYQEKVLIQDAISILGSKDKSERDKALDALPKQVRKEIRDRMRALSGAPADQKTINGSSGNAIQACQDYLLQLQNKYARAEKVVKETSQMLSIYSNNGSYKKPDKNQLRKQHIDALAQEIVPLFLGKDVPVNQPIPRTDPSTGIVDDSYRAWAEAYVRKYPCLKPFLPQLIKGFQFPDA